MAYSNNGTITSSGAAQDILSAGHAFMNIVVTNESDTACRIRVDGTASSNTGDNVPAGAEKIFSNLLGRRVSVFGATTGKAFSFREA